MSLQMEGIPVDSPGMDATPRINSEQPSDQELVDIYALHSDRVNVTRMTVSQVREASEAAYGLELRGYIEQAGIWLHNSRPAL